MPRTTTKTSVCAPIAASLMLAALVMALPTSVAARVHPADAMIPDDQPFPTASLMAWWPGSSRAFAAKGTTISSLAGVAKAATLDWGEGWSFDGLNGTRTMVSSSFLSAKGAGGLTISVNYQLPAGQKPLDGWAPIFMLTNGTEIGWTWALLMNSGVPQLLVRSGPGIKPASSAKNAAGVQTQRIDDHKMHQIVLRVARPGCSGGKCPAPERLLVSIIVDGNVISEEMTTLPTLKTKPFAFTNFFHGSMWDASKTNLDFTGQPNFKNGHLESYGAFNQLLVYDRALAVSELQAVRRASELGVAGQFPPFGAQEAGWSGPKASVGPGLPSSDLRSSGPLPADQATNVLAYGAKTVRAVGTAQIRVISGWIKFSHSPTAETKLLTFDSGLQAPIELFAIADGDATKVGCRPVGSTDKTKWNMTSFSFGKGGAAWHYVRLTATTNAGPWVMCDVDFTRLGGALFQPRFGAATAPPAAERLRVHPGVEVATLVMRTPSKSELANLHYYHLDPLHAGPAIWLAGDKLKTIRSLAPWNKKVEFGWWWKTPIHHPLGPRYLSPPHKPKTYKTAAVNETDAMTLVVRLTQTKSLAPGLPACVMHRSATALDFSLRLCIVGFGDALNGYMMFGTRMFQFPLLVLVNKPAATLVITTPYPRVPAVLKGWGMPAGSLQPDIYLGDTKMAGSFWKEIPSTTYFPNNTYVNGKVDADKVGDQRWWGAGSDPPIIVEEFRVYQGILRDPVGIGRPKCGKGMNDRCRQAGRLCLDQKAPLSSRCGGCTANYFALGGFADGSLECRLKRLGAGKCRADVMCASGACDLTRGVCLYKKKAPCDVACRLNGRLCTAQKGAFDCGGCLAFFAPTGGAKSATFLGPKDSCAWSPTRDDNMTCSDSRGCKSGACDETVVDSRDEVSVVGGWKSTITKKCGDGLCGGACARCPSYRFSPSISWAKNVQRKERRCRVIAPNVPSANAADAPCAVLVGRLPVGGSAKTITRPDGSVVKTIQCDAGAAAACTNPTEVSRAPILSATACSAMVSRIKVEPSATNCHIKFKWSFLASLKCNLIHGVLGPKTVATKAIEKTNPANFGPIDLVRAFHPTLSDAQRNNPGLIYNHGQHFKPLRRAGVGLRLIEYAFGSQAEKAALVAKHGQFLPLLNCSAAIPAAVKAKSPYHTEYNWHACVPEPQEDGAKCPPAGATKSKDLYCLSNYCSRKTGLCERGDNPLFELRGNGKGGQKKGKSAVKFGVVRVDDTAVDLDDQHKSNAAKAGKTRDYKYTASMSQRYVSCILGKPMPPTPLLQTDIEVDRTAGGKDCAETSMTLRILGFDMSALKPESPLACTAASYTTKGTGFDVCVDATTAECDFKPEKLLTAPLAQFFPSAAVCVPTDELELPEVKKDFKEALVPLIISIGLEFDLCIEYSFGLDSASNAPQVSVTPGMAIGVVARGGVGSGETGAYEISAGVRLALTLVSLKFPVTWGIEVDAVLTSVTDDIIKGMFTIKLIQRITMALEFLSGEFGLYAQLEIGPFGIEWVFNIFEWTGLQLSVTLSEIPLISTSVDFQVPRRVPPASAAGACETNDCYK